MAGRNNRREDPGSFPSLPTISSSQVQSPQVTTSTFGGGFIGPEVLQLISIVFHTDVARERQVDPAGLLMLSELRDLLALLTFEQPANNPPVIQEKVALYCADPLFLPFPAAGVDDVLGPTRDLEDMLRCTVAKLLRAKVKTLQFHTVAELNEEKGFYQVISEQLGAIAEKFESRIETIREQREVKKGANVATPGSVNVERLVSATLDRVPPLVRVLGAWGTGNKELKDATTSGARSLEKILCFFRRPKAAAQEVVSSNLDIMRYSRKLERRLSFSLYLVWLIIYQLLDFNTARNIPELFEELKKMAQMFWILREIVRQRESAVDELCHLMVERNAVGAVERAQRTG